MSGGRIRVGIGTRFLYDGELVEVIEMHPAAAGVEVLLRSNAGHGDVVRVALRELLDGHRARTIPDENGPAGDDPDEPADVVLSAMTASERQEISERAAHIREALTGYRSGAESVAAEAPELIRPALAGIGGRERLERFSASMRYRTLTDAADNLGIDQVTLLNQINRIESELGTKLLSRAERGRPSEITDAGARVVATIRAWQRVRETV